MQKAVAAVLITAAFIGACSGRLSTTPTIRRLRQQNDALADQVRTDPLTGVLNQVGLEQAYAASDDRGRFLILVDLQMLSLAVRHGALAANPVREVGRLPRPRRPVTALTLEELAIIREAIVARQYRRTTGPKRNNNLAVASAIAKGVKDLIAASLGGRSYGRILATIASVFILGLGITAALNQIGVATTVTTPVLVAILATIAGVIVVGVGGGLIKPMQARAEHWLSRAEQEGQNIAAQASTSSTTRTATATQLHEPVATDPTQPLPGRRTY